VRLPRSTVLVGRHPRDALSLRGSAVSV
jgi:hypothetical protein